MSKAVMRLKRQLIVLQNMEMKRQPLKVLESCLDLTKPIT